MFTTISLKFSKHSCFQILILFITLQSIHSSRILFYAAESSYSHRIAVWPYIEKLAELGHNLTYLSPFEPKVKNPLITEIIPTKLAQFINSSFAEFDPIDYRSLGFYQMWALIFEESLSGCSAILNDPKTVDWIQKSEKFDLLIVDSLVNECAYLFVHLHKCPVVIYGTTSYFMWHLENLGLPDESSWIPNMDSVGLKNQMTFFQRAKNTLSPLYWHFYRNFYYFPAIEKIVKEGLNIDNLSSFEEIDRNVSLMLLNSHFSEDFGRSVPPGVVHVGGMHLNDVENSLKKQLIPEDMLKFIDASTNGFILVSFGTVVPISLKLNTNVLKSLFETFEQMSNIRFIVKWVGDKPEILPKNVFLSEWIPQQHVLAHPKILAFVTHGGLLGVQESIYFGVPLVVLPLFGDQDYNAQKIQHKKIGIQLEILNLTPKILTEALKSVISDKEYKENMAIVSLIFRTRPQSALESAIWWTELILAHPKIMTKYLKSGNLNNNWFTKRSLDVWLIIFIIILTILFIFMYILVLTFKFLFICSTKKLILKNNIKEKSS